MRKNGAETAVKRKTGQKPINISSEQKKCNTDKL